MKPVVALMMSKDEADIIATVLAGWRAQDIPVLAIDDSSDGTFDILRSFDNVTALRQRDHFPDGAPGMSIWVMNPLLELKRRRFGPDTWVLIANADELWYHAPRRIAAAMEAEGAGILLARMCNHLPHPEDAPHFDFEAGRWQPEKAALPLAERLPWYTAYWLEHRGFLDRPGLAFAPGQGLLPPGTEGPVFSRRPLIQHHSIRDPLQAVARAKDRVERDFQPAYRPYFYRRDPRDTFHAGFPDLGVELERFTGDYGRWERGLEDLSWPGRPGDPGRLEDGDGKT